MLQSPLFCAHQLWTRSNIIFQKKKQKTMVFVNYLIILTWPVLEQALRDTRIEKEWHRCIIHLRPVVPWLGLMDMEGGGGGGGVVKGKRGKKCTSVEVTGFSANKMPLLVPGMACLLLIATISRRVPEDEEKWHLPVPLITAILAFCEEITQALSPPFLTHGQVIYTANTNTHTRMGYILLPNSKLGSQRWAHLNRYQGHNHTVLHLSERPLSLDRSCK